jgi:hypothetical protein
MKNLFILFLFLCFGHQINAQAKFVSNNISLPRFNVGGEAQWYPAGLIFGLRSDLYYNKHENINLRIGYNLTDRQDFSKFNDNEKGGGFGFGVGYRYYVGKRKGIYLGIRTDFWWLDIDWTDFNESLQIDEMGTTEVVVFQPTIEIGYQFILDKHWIIAPAFTNGREINVISKGEDVGQGWITLIGLNVSYKLF